MQPKNLSIINLFPRKIIYCIYYQSLNITYLHGKIDNNYTVVNQNLLHPYDKRCRSYILFLSDVVRARDVLGPQTDNRVVLIPRSTQWKLQEFLSSKAASDIINLLVIGESLSTNEVKVRIYSFLYLGPKIGKYKIRRLCFNNIFFAPFILLILDPKNV